MNLAFINIFVVLSIFHYSGLSRIIGLPLDRGSYRIPLIGLETTSQTCFVFSAWRGQWICTHPCLCAGNEITVKPWKEATGSSKNSLQLAWSLRRFHLIMIRLNHSLSTCILGCMGMVPHTDLHRGDLAGCERAVSEMT